MLRKRISFGLAGLVLAATVAVTRLDAPPTIPGFAPPTTNQANTVSGAPEGAAASLADPVLHGAWYELAFTQPTRSGLHEGTSPVEQLLLDLLRRSQQTLDVAIYDIDLESVTDALVQAAERGVRVRMVVESEQMRSQQATKKAAVEKLLGAGIPLVADRPNGLMHNKFTVADGRWVQTGSWNYTFSETYRNNNNAIVIESQELAANYTAEFEKMFERRLFGPAKTRGVPHPILSLAGARTENYFSPGDRSAGQVIRWIGSAQQQVHFLAFSFTQDGIGDAMAARFRSGIPVRGVFEASETRNTYSEYAKLKTAGADVMLDANPWKLHHKVMVLDRRISIFGSFNFSAAADRENDENLLIVDDPGLAAAFEAEYERIRKTALRQ